MVQAFIAEVTELMRIALREHGKFRTEIAPDILQDDANGQKVLELLSALPTKQRKPATKLLEAMAATYDVDSSEFSDFAPVLIKAVNSAEVLIELVRTGHNPTTLGNLVVQLQELADVERSDVLKLFRARRHAIDALQKLEERSHAKGAAYEKDLHLLLKGNPWLIRPEFSTFLTSDEPLGNVARKLDEKLGIDTKAPEGDNTRPDLVFAAVDKSKPSDVIVVELKSPDPKTPLNYDHLRQLKNYMSTIEEIVGADLTIAPPNVHGFLIGTMAEPDSKALAVKELRREMKEAGPGTKWKVIPLPQLFQDARAIHVDVIEALEAEEAELEG